ncbi:MBL fold metallo-hydrolase [Halovenus sp. WSH3]|uniref:MBL fold metallo-hydrolase n=1 Tax=Halovenus carboxidivorans TaxID=2692199 RepID=A0A6B0SYE4_9EURY|nr:MBL fold metallo-hydrolase [Halovenus carboxidivorans]MXR50584.1 MBL fold metallo-hydrolase [Halovenus carboxidivorans]
MSRDSLQLVRNATLVLTIDDTTFLVDPMFAAEGSAPSIGDKPGVPDALEVENDRRNPMVPMPDVDLSHDAVLVTHRHDDHFDEPAREQLDADVPLFCQPADEEAFVEEGFTDVRPVDDERSFGGITIHRTPGRHGHGELGEMMGPVSGFVFEGEQSLYLAGDTVWYDPVEQTLDEFDPETVVLNGGAAQFVGHEPITMGTEDIAAVREATDATVIVDHMEAINHCLLTREELRSTVPDVQVPEDGEEITIE